MAVTTADWVPKLQDLTLADALDAALRARVDAKTKPIGALGLLESIAIRLGRIQHSEAPRVERPTVIVFAADHGIAVRGVSAYPREVTAQMVHNFAAGGAAINCFASLNALHLEVVDAGVDADLRALTGVVHEKIARSTRDFVVEPAMSEEQFERAFTIGRARAFAAADAGATVLGLGEMGIGNTSSASLLLALLTGIDIARATGPGTGLDADGVARKRALLGQAYSRITVTRANRIGDDPEGVRQVLIEAGGFEIVMMLGAMLGAAERRIAVVVDGFIAGVACLAATRLQPALIGYCFFAHRSAEPAHGMVLGELGARPLLDLDLRLGEGTGAALAVPLLRAACAFLAEMASFDSAGVSNRGS